jgi:hypothetical protein
MQPVSKYGIGKQASTTIQMLKTVFSDRCVKRRALGHGVQLRIGSRVLGLSPQSQLVVGMQFYTGILKEGPKRDNL